MKTPLTIRVEPRLLEEVRHRARRENRTLTNFIETVLQERLTGGNPEHQPATTSGTTGRESASNG